MPTSDGRRPVRVAKRIRDHVAEALLRELGDPRLASVIVTGVDVPPDLGVARISVRLLTEADERRRREVVGALRRAAGKLRRGLGPSLGIKRVPTLEFRYDTGPDAAERVDQLLGEIAAERPPKSAEPGEPAELDDKEDA